MIRLAIAGAGDIANIHCASAMTIPELDILAMAGKYPNNAGTLAKKHSLCHQFETVE